MSPYLLKRVTGDRYHVPGLFPSCRDFKRLTGDRYHVPLSPPPYLPPDNHVPLSPAKGIQRLSISQKAGLFSFVSTYGATGSFMRYSP